MNKRYLTVISLFLILLGSIASLTIMGRSARVYREAHNISDGRVSAVIVNKTTDVYYLWKTKGFKGRVVLNIGKFPHFSEVDSRFFYKIYRESEVSGRDIIKNYENELNYENFLRVAMEGNIAREVYNMLPPDAFKKVSEDGLTREKSIKQTDDEIINHITGSKLVIARHVPPLKEPVLINVDASYFSSGTNDLVRELRASNINSDLVTFCLSEDNPDVTDNERERLLEFARQFSVQGKR